MRCSEVRCNTSRAVVEVELGFWDLSSLPASFQRQDRRRSGPTDEGLGLSIGAARDRGPVGHRLKVWYRESDSNPHEVALA